MRVNVTSNFGPWVTGRSMVCMIKIGKLVKTGGKGLSFRHDPFEVIEEHGVEIFIRQMKI